MTSAWIPVGTKPVRYFPLSGQLQSQGLLFSVRDVSRKARMIRYSYPLLALWQHLRATAWA